MSIEKMINLYEKVCDKQVNKFDHWYKIRIALENKIIERIDNEQLEAKDKRHQE